MMMDTDFWHSVNDVYPAFLAVGVARPLIGPGGGIKGAARVGEALGLSYLTTRGLKSVSREERPGGGSHDSFPSGHATGAFSVASMNAAFYPKEAPFWYAGAALFAVARNEIGVHYFKDIVAGAAVGYGFGRFLVGRHDGLVIAPLFRGDARGAMVSVRF